MAKTKARDSGSSSACHEPGPKESAEERQRRIAQLAYDLHVLRGSKHGHDLDDWLDAEQELDAAA